MTTLDRIIARPGCDGSPARWFFKSSEGLIGPFDSHETAQRMLADFVKSCREQACK